MAHILGGRCNEKARYVCRAFHTFVCIHFYIFCAEFVIPRAIPHEIRNLF